MYYNSESSVALKKKKIMPRRRSNRSQKLYYAQAFPVAPGPVTVLAANVPFTVSVPVHVHQKGAVELNFAASLSSTGAFESNVVYNILAGPGFTRSLTGGAQPLLRLAAQAIPAGGAQAIAVAQNVIDELSGCYEETYNLVITNLNANPINLNSYSFIIHA